MNESDDSSDNSNIVPFPIKNRKLDDDLDGPVRLIPRPLEITEEPTKEQIEQSKKVDRFWDAVRQLNLAYIDYENFDGEDGTREMALEAVCGVIEVAMTFKTIAEMLRKRSNQQKV